MAERLTPYLLRRAIQLPLADKTALIGHLQASINAPVSPAERMAYLCRKMEAVSGVMVTHPSRTRDIVMARNIFAFVARREGYSQQTIGKFLGRDHSTVAFAEKRMREVFTYPSIYKDEIKLYNKSVESL